MSKGGSERSRRGVDARYHRDVVARQRPHQLCVARKPFENILRKSAYSIGMFTGERLVGLLIMPKPTIVQMLFTHPDWTRQGIGRSLWSHARAHLESAVPEVRTVELNALPFALRFYRYLGFAPISAEYVNKGARATRTACWLPAAALGAVLS